MEKPKCPYCGEEQYLTIEDHREIGRMEYYLCIQCGSRSPVKTTMEEAYDAAMKRERAKGEWVEFEQRALGHTYLCSVCQTIHWGISNFCPHCGADMREEVNDER